MAPTVSGQVAECPEVDSALTPAWRRGGLKSTLLLCSIRGFASMVLPVEAD